MTERCGLAALVLLQRWVNNWRFVAVLLISHLNGNSEISYAKLPELLNFNFFLEEKRAIAPIC
ncbi:hypothetical protein CK516_24860 [Nostoc sp. 'Peltigera malacea cyanobiont' DB3992]|nr:hypothetical protein CK516_24860 [Nostoc sp. 'Peltigera malacea cyanobiont' DB3992]